MKKLTDQLKEMGLDKVIKNDLRVAYKETLKDKHFKEMVSKLKLNDDVLMQYTSLLKASSKEYKNCLNCSGLVECKNEITGYAHLPLVIDSNLEFAFLACRYQKDYQKTTNHLKNVNLLEMPKSLKEASIVNIKKDDEGRIETIMWLLSFLKNYPNNKKGLYLHGNFGSGKTYLIAAVFNELAKQNIKSSIVYWPEFLSNLKGSFKTGFFDKLETIKTVPLLLIDDIGAESVTEWGRDEILGSILQYRMQEKLLTFFTSNLDLKNLETHLSVSKDNISKVKAKRIIERIQQLAEPKLMIAKNLRK